MVKISLSSSRFSSKIFILLVLLLSLLTRFYWIPQKVGLHLDESFSVLLSECKEIALTKNFDENRIYSGADIKNIAWGASSSFSDALSDIKQLQIDTRDSPHTNLYYSILRLCLTGTNGNLRDIIDRGCYLNVFFWLFSFFFLYKLLKHLFDDDLVIALTLLVASIGTSSLSNAMFIRPYGLQETLFIILTYVFACIYQSMENTNKQYDWKIVLPLSVLLSFVLLSGYLALGYVALLGGVLVVISWKKNQKKTTRSLIASFVLSLLLANVFYQMYLSGFSTGSYRAAECYGILLNYKHFLLALLKSTGRVLEAIFVYLLLPFFVISLLSFRQIRPENFSKNDRIAVIILACSLVWSMVSYAVVPYRDPRYIFPVFPMFTLVIPLILNRIQANAKNLILSFIALVYTAIAFNPPEPNGYLIKQRIRNLYRETGAKYLFNSKPEFPVLVYCNNDLCRIAGALIFFDDKQKYQFAHSYDSLVKQLSKYDHAFVVVENLPEICSKFVIPDGYELVGSPNFSNDPEVILVVTYELAKKLQNSTHSE